MKINGKNHTVTLSCKETRVLEYEAASEADAILARALHAAHALADRTQRPVEIYAAASCGGVLD
jgi:methionine synthase I (cobalamin-dependent)